MELLKELNMFMLSGWGVLVSVGIIAWLMVGIILFRKIFVMGLIGCVGKNDGPFVVMYTVACILLWPAYLLWMFTGVIDIKSAFKKAQGCWPGKREQKRAVDHLCAEQEP